MSRLSFEKPQLDPFSRALVGLAIGKQVPEVRLLACREGWSYHHVQAIIVSIDQYAESALGNRDYFLNQPHGSG